MPPKRGNQKPKGKGQPKRKNPAPVNWNKPASAKEKRARARFLDSRSTQGRQLGNVGNAVLVRQPRIGMPDLMAHTVSWVCGSVYVGNGTLGATNSVYFLTASGTYTNSQPTPIVGADTDIGASFVAAIEKLYRRKRIRKVRVCALATQSSTTNNLTLTMAPVRGPPDLAETGQGKTDTTAAITQANAMSMTGAKTVDSFEDCDLDLTPYISGGAGAAQNEFAIGNPTAADTSVIHPGEQADLLGVAPAAFIVAGNSTVTALQGTSTHQIVVTMVVDYLDFVGGVPVLQPEALAAGVWPARKPVAGRVVLDETREEKRTRLMGELSALVRADQPQRRDSSPSPHAK
jgi:hypothetical protein